MNIAKVISLQNKLGTVISCSSKRVQQFFYRNERINSSRNLSCSLMNFAQTVSSQNKLRTEISRSAKRLLIEEENKEAENVLQEFKKKCYGINSKSFSDSTSIFNEDEEGKKDAENVLDNFKSNCYDINSKYLFNAFFRLGI